MKVLNHLFFTLIFSISAQAELKLDSPEALLSRASQNRQELRQVVLDLNQQLSEMRNPRTFESYFQILDQLQVYSDQFSLDDVYPDAVRTLGIKMAQFSIKWMDLSQFEAAKLSVYLKRFDIEAYGALLASTNYLVKSMDLKDAAKLSKLGLNLEYIVLNHVKDISDRPDLALGYRDLLSYVATQLITQNLVSDQEKDFWFAKIYTSSGLSLFLDSIQKKIFELNRKNKALFPIVTLNLLQAFKKHKELIDLSAGWLKDRTSDLAIELIRKSLESGHTLSPQDLDQMVSEFSSRYLQSLSMVTVSTPENFLIDNSETIENIISVLQPKLVASYLLTDASQLDSFAGRSLASIRMRAEQREGTYELKDKKGRKYYISIISTRPLDLAISVVDQNWMIFKNYFYVRYDAQQQEYTAAYSMNDTDVGTHRSLLKIKFNKNKITVVDEYAVADMRELTGQLIEQIKPVRFSQKVTPGFSKKYAGVVQYTKPNKSAQKFEMIIQSNGQNMTARVQDKNGPVYDFNQGFVSEEGFLILNTGRLLNTSWVQFRGQISENKLVGTFIVGGRGLVTEEFKLLEVKE